MPKRRNPEAIKRARAAKYLHNCLLSMKADPTAVAREIKIDAPSVRRLPVTAPQLRVLMPVGSYIKDKARSCRDGGLSLL